MTLEALGEKQKLSEEKKGFPKKKKSSFPETTILVRKRGKKVSCISFSKNIRILKSGKCQGEANYFRDNNIA